MSSDDIVTRLREAGGGYFVAQLHNQAADEIERLRKRLLGEENAYDILRLENERLRNGGCARDQNTTQFCAEAMTLQQQRDEARRRVCELLVRSGGVFRRVGRKNVECTTVEEIAEISGWDCFKEAQP